MSSSSSSELGWALGSGRCGLEVTCCGGPMGDADGDGVRQQGDHNSTTLNIEQPEPVSRVPVPRELRTLPFSVPQLCLAKHALPPAVAFATHDHGPPDHIAIRHPTLRPRLPHLQGPTARLSAFVGLASSPSPGPSGDWIVSTRAAAPPLPSLSPLPQCPLPSPASSPIST